MPEGHTVHRLARDQNEDLAGHEVRTSAVQDRFAEGAARLDGQVLRKVEAYGKHMFSWFEGGDVLHIHLGLFGKWRRSPSPPPPPIGEVRLRLIGPARTWDLAGAITSRVVDPGERDRTVAGLLHPVQHHDLDQAAHMQRLCRGIKTDIGWHHSLDQCLVQRLIIGAIGQKATLHHHAHEIGFRVVGHCRIVHSRFHPAIYRRNRVRGSPC